MAALPFVILQAKSTKKSHRTNPGAILLGKTLNGTKSIPDSCHIVQGRRDKLALLPILMGALPDAQGQAGDREGQISKCSAPKPALTLAQKLLHSQAHPE